METKRQFRELPDATKQKISDSLSGKTKSIEHRAHISQGLRDYWRGVPSVHGTQL